MYGRYGLDSFGKFTIIVSLVLMLLANFVPARLGSVLSLLCWALLIYTYFRMFSRQTYKRACENQAYLAKTAKVRHFFASQRHRERHITFTNVRLVNRKYVYQKAKAVLKSAVRNVTQHLSRRAK